MVHAYVQDGRLPAHKLGKMTAIRRADFLAFQRAKKGRPRTQNPVWRQSVGDNVQYVTIILATIKPGQRDNLTRILTSFRTESKHMLPGTVDRSVILGLEEPDDVYLVLKWRSTVMPKAAERKAAIEDLKEELAGVVEWKSSVNKYGMAFLHT